jgi:hypothetical protein
MLTKLDNSIRELAKAFLLNPYDYFQEREVHSQFFSICRNQFGSAKVNGTPSVEVSLLRQEYNTVWRLIRSEAFADRYESRGKPGSLDFAILRAEFVEKKGLLCVVNKDENIRREVRKIARDTTHSPVVVVGIEFKMAHVRAALEVSAREVQELESGMVIDAQKLAQEWVEYGYLVGFCHGSTLGDARAQQIAEVCATSFRKIHPNGTLYVYLVAPSLTTGILMQEFASGEVQKPSLSPVNSVPAAEPIVATVADPVPVVDGRPANDSVYQCPANGNLYFVRGAGPKTSRVVQLGVEGPYFPESGLILNVQLQPAIGNHQIAGCSPNNDQEYEYAPPTDESNAPCPVPCCVLVLDRGRGRTSRVSVEGYPSFIVKTHHLKRQGCEAIR